MRGGLFPLQVASKERIILRLHRSGCHRCLVEKISLWVECAEGIYKFVFCIINYVERQTSVTHVTWVETSCKRIIKY